MRAAVIDTGTNSTRLYVADISERGEQTKLVRALNTTRLGEGIGSSAVLLPEPMERTSRTICDFVQQAKELLAEKIFIYATNAVRDAKNGKEFAAMVEKACGIPMNIISGELEGRIAYMGAAQGDEHCAVIDIGGGSTEVILKPQGALKALSLPLGAVRLKERFPSVDGRLTGSNRAALIEYLDKELEQYNAIGAAQATQLIGVSGSPTALAAYSMGMKQYQPEYIQGLRIALDKLVMLLDSLSEMTLEQRKKADGIPADRADIIVYGGHILTLFMKKYHYSELTVSDRDSLEGYLEYRLFECK